MSDIQYIVFSKDDLNDTEYFKAYFSDLKNNFCCVNEIICKFAKYNNILSDDISIVEDYFGFKFTDNLKETLKKYVQVSKDYYGIINDTLTRLTYHNFDQFHVVKDSKDQIIWSLFVWRGKSNVTKNYQYHMNILRSFKDFMTEKITGIRFNFDSLRFHKKALEYNNIKYAFAPPLGKMKELIFANFNYVELKCKSDMTPDYSEIFGKHNITTEYWPCIWTHKTVLFWAK